jgi:hypothetical protein
MPRCKNKVSQYVARGYGYREVRTRCGSTGINGQELLCDECTERLKQRYPQGWMDTPGDLCEHGHYVGTPGGPDYMCGECEDGV